jgi:hypothetical protein
MRGLLAAGSVKGERSAEAGTRSTGGGAMDEETETPLDDLEATYETDDEIHLGDAGTSSSSKFGSCNDTTN